MSKRGENIRKRNDGRWEARVLCKYSNGKVYYHSVYGKSYKEVKKKKDEFIKGETSLKVSQNNKSYISFEQLLIMWLKNKDFNQKKSTQLKYKNIIELHIIPELGNMDITQIDDVLINQFLISKRENGRLDGKGGLSNSYVKSIGSLDSCTSLCRNL